MSCVIDSGNSCTGGFVAKKSMIYVFTYHKVRESAGLGGTDFYTVSPAQLDRHVETLKARGCKQITVHELLQNQTPPEDGYILSFDDGTSDHYSVVFPLLQKHACKGIFFIPTAKLNKDGYLTNDQVQKMAAAGQVIGLHSHEHQRLDVLSAEEICGQIALSQKIMTDITGVKPVIFSPPGGFINARVRSIALEQGIRVIRTMRWGYNKQIDLTALETIPINRHTNDKKFLNILEQRDSQLLYAAKETLKRLVPLRSYERLRGLVFKFSKN